MADLTQLFDETYGAEGEYSRTIWYSYIEQPLDEALVKQVSDLIKHDLTVAQPNTPTATHWVFYGAVALDDALGEKVRSSLLVREKDGTFVANVSLGDFAFVMAYDEYEDFRQAVLQQLTN